MTTTTTTTATAAGAAATATSSVTPTEADLKVALIKLRTEHPTLGIPKLHALLLAAQPSWTVSEKRTRKVLQAEGLVLSADPKAKTAAAGNKNDAGDAHNRADVRSGTLYPSSKMIEGLDVSKYSTKVAVKYFGREKGKGLIATERIEEGEVVWKEDPFILAPEW